MKSFRNWTRQEIADRFGLDVKESCGELDRWIEMPFDIEANDRTELKRLQEKLKRNVDVWNEQELIIKFIALLIDMVDYDSTNFKTFANRKLKGTIDGEEVSGEVDVMVASGIKIEKPPPLTWTPNSSCERSEQKIAKKLADNLMHKGGISPKASS